MAIIKAAVVKNDGKEEVIETTVVGTLSKPSHSSSLKSVSETGEHPPSAKKSFGPSSQKSLDPAVSKAYTELVKKSTAK